MLNAFVLDPQRLQPGPGTLAAINDRLPVPVLAAQPFFNPSFGVNGGGMSMSTNANGGNMSMMQQQMMMMMQMQQAMMMNMAGNGGGRQGNQLAQRMGGFADTPALPLPPAPPGAVDPRAKKGRVSYMDLDEPGGGGDGGLPY